MENPASNRTQTVVFMRHGVAAHNYLDSQGRPPPLDDPSLWDPPLVQDGKQQAVAAGHVVCEYLQQQIDLIVVSPLTRCLQTATVAFPPGCNNYVRDSPKFVCKESAREAFGIHYPDKRRNKSVLMRNWKSVEFEPEMTETDTWWRPDQRESWRGLEERTHSFLRWLHSHAERNIVVVTHGVWIECLLRSSLEGRRVYNTDAFACNLKSNCNGMELENVKLIHGLGSQ